MTAGQRPIVVDVLAGVIVVSAILAAAALLLTR